MDQVGFVDSEFYEPLQESSSEFLVIIFRIPEIFGNFYYIVYYFTVLSDIDFPNLTKSNLLISVLAVRSGQLYTCN